MNRCGSGVAGWVENAPRLSGDVDSSPASCVSFDAGCSGVTASVAAVNVSITPHADLDDTRAIKSQKNLAES